MQDADKSGCVTPLPTIYAAFHLELHCHLVLGRFELELGSHEDGSLQNTMLAPHQLAEPGLMLLLERLW